MRFFSPRIVLWTLTQADIHITTTIRTQNSSVTPENPPGLPFFIPTPPHLLTDLAAKGGELYLVISEFSSRFQTLRSMLPAVWFMWNRPQKMHNLNEKKRYKKLNLDRKIYWLGRCWPERERGEKRDRPNPGAACLEYTTVLRGRSHVLPGLTQRSRG